MGCSGKALYRDLPVNLKKDGEEKVAEYILKMINCTCSGNRDNFRREYFRPPVKILSAAEGEQHYVIYRTGRGSEKSNLDCYSAKRTMVKPGQKLVLRERAAFGIIVLRGSGEISVPGKEYLEIESPSMYETRGEIGADEVFVGAEAAGGFEVICRSAEPLIFCQHFASDSNPDAKSLKIPEFLPFDETKQ